MPSSPKEILGSSTVAVVEKLAIGCSVGRLDFRIGLHHVIAGRAGHAVLIRTIVDDGRASAKIVVRWRRRRGPLEGSRFPRIVAGLRPLEHAPKEIHKKDQLTGDRDKRRV